MVSASCTMKGAARLTATPTIGAQPLSLIHCAGIHPVETREVCLCNLCRSALQRAKSLP